MLPEKERERERERDRETEREQAEDGWMDGWMDRSNEWFFLNYMVLCENFIAREGKVESGLLESGICITLCVTSEIERSLSPLIFF